MLTEAPMNVGELMSVPAAIKLFGVSRPTLQSWIDRERDPLPLYTPTGLSGHGYIIRSEAIAWLRRHRKNPRDN